MKFKKHLYMVELIESGQHISTEYVTWCANPEHFFDKYIAYLAFLDFDNFVPCNFIGFDDFEYIISEII
jgi:hypothetical protein